MIRQRVRRPVVRRVVLAVPATLLCISAHAAIYETTYSHDILNGLVTETNPNGEVIQYHHDAVDRLTKIVLDAGASPAELNFTWDLTDQLERITYPGGAQDFTYDNLDRLETITDFGSSGPLLHFSYDHQDRVTWIVYSASNGAVCYEYDPDGRITRVGRVFSGSGTVCGAADEKTDYSYDSKGRLSTIAHPNGITGFIEYDAITGQMKSAGYRRGNGTLIYRDEFTYVPGTPLYSRITRTTATDSTSTDYTYDAWQRLTSVIEADGRRTAYEYDPFGNRTRETLTNVHDPEATGGEPKAYGDYTYEYGARSNRLTRILKDGVELETFTYDNAGRMTERTHATDGTTTYSYDPRGLLTGVIKPGSTISYTYDALGARKTKTVNGVTTRYLTAQIFGMSRVLAELDTSMNFKATYVYGGHQLLKEEPVAGDHGKDLYLLADGIVGSITHAVDGDGIIRNQYGYDAFGIRSALTVTPSGSHGHYGYTGQEYDEEAGLLYLRARYYVVVN